MVLRGHLHIAMDDRSIDLRDGEVFVVPKGVRHNPSAAEECLVMLIERKSTQHSGDTINARTRSIAEQLRPIDHAEPNEPGVA